MQRSSIITAAVVLCAACGGHKTVPSDDLRPIAEVVEASHPTPVASVEGRGRPADGLMAPLPTDADRVLELDGPAEAPGPVLPPPSQLEGSDPASKLEPRLIDAPGLDADATTVATYVAETWGNTGPGIAPWHETADDYLTDSFSESFARRDLAVDDLPASATAVEATSRPTPTGERVTVTLEQVQASAEVPWRLVTVEMLVVDVDGRALVASLEVLA